jgi:uncharacterized protein YifN (PemK superfamily)
MAITFTPRRGAILMCDFGPNASGAATFPLLKAPVGMPPEIWKVRRAIVVSPDALNHRHAASPGMCIVVPLSATKPKTVGDHDVPITRGSYKSLTVDVWARCASVTAVSHGRLDRPFAGRRYISEYVAPTDMSRIEAGLRAALGM